MKITVEEIKNIKETEVVIKCNNSSDSQDIIAALYLFDKKVLVKKEDRNFLLKLNEIFYFDSVENKVFCYTEKDVYETNLKLYEIESIYKNTVFCRVNKNTVLNVNKIKNFKAALNGKMEVILINGEKIEISRNYVTALKIVLGGIN